MKKSWLKFVLAIENYYFYHAKYYLPFVGWWYLGVTDILSLGQG